ncbi:MAG: ATP-dependent DNA helicase RecG [Leptospiraceae bacterium]|nr:ATP-dependent DNA helicase RecG [Leptospiraceae bacterium]
MAKKASKKKQKTTGRKKAALKTDSSEQPAAQLPPGRSSRDIAWPGLPDLGDLKGLGPGRVQCLQEHNIHSVIDLVYYFPRRYVDRRFTDSALLQAGLETTLIVEVLNKFMAYGRRSRLTVRCQTLQGAGISLVFFKGTAWFQHQFEPGDTLVISGKLDDYRGFQMIHPDFEKLDGDEEQQLLHAGGIIPIYPGSDALRKNRLDSRGLRRLIHPLLETADWQALDPLSAAVRKQYALLPYQQALNAIHFPQSDDLRSRARCSLVFEELYLYLLLLYHRARLQSEKQRELWPLGQGNSIEWPRLQSRLSFRLTGEQERVIAKLTMDCARNHPNAWLLQGDVGSGKTLVALGLALHFMEAGIQTALMAPTEVLARQHFLTITSLLGFEWQQRIELLAGKVSAKKRTEIRERLLQGEILLLIGTHSLLEADIQFRAMGLVIIDEQHRFGVEQREALRSKGKQPDLLSMTATPIPRSLCLTEFSDLELVTLREKPAGRQPIQTMWLPDSRRSGLYQSIRNHVAGGRQGYIVYPLIDESEKMDLRAASDAFVELRDVVFPELRLALLHGRLKSDEKQSIMQEFRAGQLDLLVTTTVIEVGVDVPNATMMIIEHAERFGISQLHQLRGRVGRGTEQSFCVLMSDAVHAEAVERLQALVDSDDGFYLAEVDLKMRGPGELLGLRQHGLPALKLADLVNDKEIIADVWQAVRQFPEPNQNAVRMIQSRFAEGVEIFAAS